MTSNHAEVVCDSCNNGNFSGLRYKCLICDDYDLCSNCYNTGSYSSHHRPDHPMQCIVAKDDFDLFYGGESITDHKIQSLTCPYCGELGFTESTLLVHVNAYHLNLDQDDPSASVYCPICNTNTSLLPYDFATHLTTDHHAQKELAEAELSRTRQAKTQARVLGHRTRKSQTVRGDSGLTELRVASGPLVELLNRFSESRRTGTTSNQATASQMQHIQSLEHQLNLDSSSQNRTNYRIEPLDRANIHHSTDSQLNSASNSTQTHSVRTSNTCPNLTYYNQPLAPIEQSSSSSNANSNHPLDEDLESSNFNQPSQSNLLPTQSSDRSAHSSPFLLRNYLRPPLTEAEQQQQDILKADQSLFLEGLLLQIDTLEKINK